MFSFMLFYVHNENPSKRTKKLYGDFLSTDETLSRLTIEHSKRIRAKHSAGHLIA